MLKVRVLCWEVRLGRDKTGRGRGSVSVVTTSVIPSALLSKFVECCLILDLSLA